MRVVANGRLVYVYMYVCMHSSAYIIPKLQLGDGGHGSFFVSLSLSVLRPLCWANVHGVRTVRASSSGCANKRAEPRVFASLARGRTSRGEAGRSLRRCLGRRHVMDGGVEQQQQKQQQAPQRGRGVEETRGG